MDTKYTQIFIVIIGLLTAVFLTTNNRLLNMDTQPNQHVINILQRSIKTFEDQHKKKFYFSCDEAYDYMLFIGKLKEYGILVMPDPEIRQLAEHYSNQEAI